MPFIEPPTVAEILATAHLPIIRQPDAPIPRDPTIPHGRDVALEVGRENPDMFYFLANAIDGELGEYYLTPEDLPPGMDPSILEPIPIADDPSASVAAAAADAPVDPLPVRNTQQTSPLPVPVPSEVAVKAFKDALATPTGVPASTTFRRPAAPVQFRSQAASPYPLPSSSNATHPRPTRPARRRRTRRTRYPSRRNTPGPSNASLPSFGE